MEKYNGKSVYTICGYRVIYQPDYADFSQTGSLKGYAYEHRYVAAKKIGRRLMCGEAVHHIDGNRQNNSPDNLMVTTISKHSTLHNAIPDDLHLHCEKCGKTLHGTFFGSRRQRFCHRCYLENRHNMSKIPEKGELDELCLTKSTVEIGKIYGVSDKTIRNWIRKLGIDYKKKSGYNLNDEECRRKSKEALKLYFKTNRNCNRKEIVRCSLSGELIKAYEAIVDVRGDGFVDEMIRRTLKNDKRTYRGFLWATKSEFEKGIFAKPGIAPHF